MERLTHRAVSREADVPLGSTTYHYAGREDLLLVALERAVEEEREALARWVAELGKDPDLPRALTDLTLHAEPERERVVVAYEIYIAALRHPALRGPSTAWTKLLPEILMKFVDEATAEALAVASEALALRLLIDDPPPKRDFIEGVLRRIASH